MSDQHQSNPNITLQETLQQVAGGALDVAEAVQKISTHFASEHSRSDLDLDLARASRCGFPEAIYGQGKSAEVILDAFARMTSARQNCLATRVTEQIAIELQNEHPEAIWNPIARTVRLMNEPPREQLVKTVVITAGTTDRPVAEEAIETLRWMQYEPEIIYDAGVAGPQRLLKSLPRLADASAIVVVAGMEGALPSVVGGWVKCPVIAVPTSVGYGANFGGLSAVLGMLNSCAANVAVVNIDAGFKGGYLAGMIARQSRFENGSDRE